MKPNKDVIQLIHEFEFVVNVRGTATIKIEASSSDEAYDYFMEHVEEFESDLMEALNLDLDDLDVDLIEQLN